MAVRTTSAVKAKAIAQTDYALRPPFDFIDPWENNVGDLPTWYYPWQGFSAGMPADESRPPASRPAAGKIGLHGTLARATTVRDTSASRALTFSHFYYGKLHLDPSYLNLGNVLNSQTRQVELWNASFAPVTVNEVVASNDDGITLDLPMPTPFVLQPLQAVNVTVGVSTVGPAAMDASYLFDADVLKDAQLRVVGTRTVVFGIPPDTAKSYIEKLDWVTDVITAHDGTEQRITLNDYPDTQLSMTVQRQKESAHALDSLLWGWQHRIYAVPLWHRQTALTQAASPASRTIFCTTAYSGLRVGGLAILWSSYDLFETFEIEEIQADRVVAKRPLQYSWAPGTALAACRTARLPQEVSSSWTHADLTSVPLTFVFTEVEQETPYEFTDSYRGSPLLLWAPNWVGEMAERNVRNLDVFETDLKARYTVIKSQLPYVVKGHAWFLKGKDRIDTFRRWLYSRRGRSVPFWMPSWKADFRIVKRVEQGAVDITVARIGYQQFYSYNVGRQDIMITLKSGQRLLRRIIASAEGSQADQEVLQLDAEINQVIELNEVAMVSFLGLHRLDADAVELDWRSDKLVLCNQNMRLLTDGV